MDQLLPLAMPAIGQAALMNNAPKPKSSQMWKGFFHAGVVWEAANLPAASLLLSSGFVRAVENTNVRFSKRAKCFECLLGHPK